jgi:hypothetical protein
MSPDLAEASPAQDDKGFVGGFRRLRWIGIVAGLIPMLAAMICLRIFSGFTISDLFFREQDLPVLLIMGIAFFVLPACGLSGGRWRRVAAWLELNPGAFAMTVAGVTFVAAFLGVFLICRDYPLSVDEFLATFDAQIFRRGALLAGVPERWRAFVPALQPIYLLDVADHSAWSSSYYPMNAAFRALLDLVGLNRAAGAAWAALSTIMTFGLARTLWPARPAAAVVATALLATSSQVLFTAMTPYAMSAHLALNLLWLTLFLRRDRASVVAALAVAFAACGLHQLIFHPLFAAPFIAQLWLERRLRRAIAYTVGYGAIGLFWASYWRLALSSMHLAATASVERGPHYLTDTLRMLLGQVDAHALQLASENLVRLVAWQNPLTIGLALIGAPAAWRAGGVLRSLLLGVVLTFVVVAVLQPYQGHGWGYRYLHGLMGSLCLIGALGWIELWGRGGTQTRQAGLAAVLASAAFTVLVLFPIRAFQINQYTAPYARAEALIRRQDADVVLLNGEGLLFPYNLVRNDPWLNNRPKVMAVAAMDQDLLDRVCRTLKVAVFDRSTGRAVGIRAINDTPFPIDAVFARRVKAGGCGTRIIPARP